MAPETKDPNRPGAQQIRVARSKDIESAGFYKERQQRRSEAFYREFGSEVGRLATLAKTLGDEAKDEATKLKEIAMCLWNVREATFLLRDCNGAFGLDAIRSALDECESELHGFLVDSLDIRLMGELGHPDRLDYLLRNGEVASS